MHDRKNIHKNILLPVQNKCFPLAKVLCKLHCLITLSRTTLETHPPANSQQPNWTQEFSNLKKSEYYKLLCKNEEEKNHYLAKETSFDNKLT